MLRAFLILCAGFSLGLTAHADAQACAGASEQSCMFEAIWDAAASLPPEKKSRIQPFFLETVGQAGNTPLLLQWQSRLGAPALHRSPAIDYTADQAGAVVAESGWDGFEQRARARTVPFNTGRPEIMAAGVRLAPDDATRRRLTDAMFDLVPGKTARGGPGDDFERSDFGHVLAELAMQACDLGRFDQALALTAAPDSLRYALWRARITGGAGMLAPRIRKAASPDDTRHVRGALEGYAPILTLGYCPR